MILEARGLFAKRGFYGASISQIAGTLGMTKQTLLHHFQTKEKLYGLVLEQIASELVSLRPSSEEGTESSERLVDYFCALVADTPEDTERSQLLMRELLDNPSRADRTRKWPLGPFLKDLTEMTRATPGWSNASDARILAVIIQILGSVHYYSVSEPTVRSIFGPDLAGSINAIYEQQLRASIRAILSAGAAS